MEFLLQPWFTLPLPVTNWYRVCLLPKMEATAHVVAERYFPVIHDPSESRKEQGFNICLFCLSDARRNKIIKRAFLQSQICLGLIGVICLNGAHNKQTVAE